MSLHDTKNPNAGVIWLRGIELPDPGDPLRFVKELLGALNAQLRLGMLCEPARGACPELVEGDPHAEVVWGLGGENPPGYPLGQCFSFSSFSARKG